MACVIYTRNQLSFSFRIMGPVGEFNLGSQQLLGESDSILSLILSELYGLLAI